MEQIRERCVVEGLPSALERRKQTGTSARRLYGDGEARLVSIACRQAPEGYAAWTLKLLGERLVELEIIESISNETIRQVLKKHYKTMEKGDVVHST